MNKLTDLRLADYPTMTVVLPDEAGTTVHVSAPTVDLCDELRANERKIYAVLRGKEGDARTSRAVYELAAQFLNCNDDNFTTTAQELATKYRLSLRVLDVFFRDYAEFLKSLEHEKN